MNRKHWMTALILLAAFGIAGTHLLTAQEPIIRGSRATTRQIKDAQAERVTLTATAPHTVGRCVQELRALAADLEKAGHSEEAGRLNHVISQLTRRAELELTEKKGTVAKLNEEIAELKSVVDQ